MREAEGIKWHGGGRVVIEVRGGVVQNVAADGRIRVMLIDHDNIEAGDSHGTFTRQN